MLEYRVTGPPGTGKTHYLARQVEAAALKHGQAAVMVTSFTRAAAREVASRVDLPEDRVGTLHAHAWRALGRPKIAEGEVKAWNQVCRPGDRLSPRAVGARLDDPLGAADDLQRGDGGDECLERSNLYRATLLHKEHWDERVLAWFVRWRAWKQEHGFLDFTDLIEQAITRTDCAPGQPAVLFGDEAQDWSPLEFALFRHWGRACTVGVELCGDAAQCLFNFKGAVPAVFFDPPLAPEFLRTLQKSYRVPATVHARACAWIRRSHHDVLAPYEPRDGDPGSVTTYNCGGAQHASCARPERLVEDAVASLEMEGRSQMFLASCAYLLQPTIAVLREQGVPFHNPYRTSQGAWNPLRGAADRVIDFLKGPRPDLVGLQHEPRLWTYTELDRWSSPLRAKGLFRHGMKTLVEQKAKEAKEDRVRRAMPIELEDLRALLEPAALQAAHEAAISATPWTFLAGQLADTQRDKWKYALRVCETRGVRGLTDDPKVVVGSIHCSPADELVLTKRGPVAIAELQPDDQLVSYHRGTNRLMGAGAHANSRGYAFQRSERPYEGQLVAISTLAGTTRVTPNHRVLVRFSEAFMDRWCVYLMRRGCWWRIGTCATAHRPYVPAGVGGRLATEQADDGWILSVHDRREDALAAEALAQAKFGIPGTTFEAAIGRALTSARLHEIHAACVDHVTPRAATLLRAYGLLVDAPLYRRISPDGIGRYGKRQEGEQRKRQLRGNFVTEAANLVALSGRIEMLTMMRGDVFTTQRWGPIPRSATVTTEPFRGSVFGLDVAPHHYYVSGGAVVHNSVKGAEADRVTVYPDLSPAGNSEWCGRAPQRDSVRRVFYVAMTRARHELVLAGPATVYAVDWSS